MCHHSIFLLDRDSTTSIYLYLSLALSVFTKQDLIWDFKYVQKQRAKFQLINVIIGTAKMVIYISRKNIVEERVGQDAVWVWQRMIQARIDFKYFSAMNDVSQFIDIQGSWCLGVGWGEDKNHVVVLFFPPCPCFVCDGKVC